MTCVNIVFMTAPQRLSCCPQLLSCDGLTSEQATQLASLFRVLGEPVRLQMLSLIAARQNQEVCACELVEPLGISQPTVSHHLKTMFGAGLLKKERRGTWIYYQIVPEQLAALSQALVST